MRSISLLLLAFLSLSATAQPTGKGKLSGTVADSLSGHPIEYASITLLEQPGMKTVNGGITDSAGRYVLTGLKTGSYSLLVEAIGYTSIRLTGILVEEAGPAIRLKTIYLIAKPGTLENVTLTTAGKLVTNKIDKLIYNAERDLTSQSGVATDILKKVPQVSVDVNGNVELAGSSSIRFLINGKPSAAFGNSVAEVLQSIPASQIKSIEVITNPGAKYDAQGLGGIINIVLKQNNTQGINGNMALAAGTRTSNSSFNFNARKGTFGVHAFLSGNYRPALNAPVTTDRNGLDTAAKTSGLLHQEGVSHFKRYGFQTGAGFDWTVKKKNNFTGSFAYNLFGNEGNGFIRQRQQLNSQAGSTLSDISSETYTSSRYRIKSIDANITYKRTFSKEDQELEISLNTNSENSHTSNDNYQLSVPQAKRFYGNTSTNPGKEKVTELTLDYAQPLGKDMMLGTGMKYVAIDISGTTTAFSFQPSTQNYLPDLFLSNSLDYKQKVYAGYAELSFSAGKLFEVKMGTRYERTEIKSWFSNAQQQASTPGYNTVVPSLFLSRKLGENQQVKLSYSKRIERPDYGDLNPFINTSDPKNLSAGNPYLLPEIGHRIEGGYYLEMGKAGSLSASLFQRLNLNDIQPFIRYYPFFQAGDSIYQNVAVTRRENIGREKNTGLMLFGDLHLTDKLAFRTNLMLFHRRTINQQNPGYNSTNFNYRFNANASYQFSNSFAAEFFGNFNSARNEAQGKYPSNVTYSFAARKQFWNKKGSLAITSTNPFANYLVQRTALFGPGFTINRVQKIPIRSFGISFTWKFGRLEFKKEKEAEPNNVLPAEN